MCAYLCSIKPNLVIMKKIDLMWFWACLCLLSLSACEKMQTEDLTGPTSGKDGVAVQFNVAELEQVPFPSASSVRATDVKTLCTRVSLAVYQSGTKISQVNQQSSDTNFGRFQLVLSPGTYQFVIIAHSGQKNPTMTDIEKITFDGKVTDTFYYYTEFTVDQSVTRDLELRRAVAMFRLTATDNVPDAVRKMHFFYTGGSSTFDAVRGVGCVNSRQSEYREVTSDMLGKPTTFEVYTFPRADSNTLKMTVTALDANDNTITFKEFPQVDIQRNMITQYTGEFFGGQAGGDTNEPGTVTLGIHSKDEWSQTVNTY